MKSIFLYNANSGNSKITSKINYIEKHLKTKYETLEIYAPKTRDDFISFLENKIQDYDYLFFSGGDGTFNIVVNILGKMEKKPIIGYIPSGTCNDISHNLKIPKNVKKAVKIILEGKTMKHDLGRINDSFFMYVVAAGTFTDVSYNTRQLTKKALGRFAYILNGIHEVFFPLSEELILKTDTYEETISAPLILIMNSKSIGGFIFNKNGHRNDGTFDVLIVKEGIKKGVINVLRLFIDSFLNLNKKKYIILHAEKKLDIYTKKNVTWCVDGEKGPDGDIHIENIKGALEIIVP